MVTSPAATPVRVAVESGTKRVFASALDWPGWCRSGRNEESALVALADYAVRYRVVAHRAGITVPAVAGESLAVVERLDGGAATDFGVPEATAQAERRAVTTAAATRRAALLTAAWAVFDDVASQAPALLRKGPRGGGRDRDKMIDHVLSSEAGYARKLGIKLSPPAIDDVAAIEAQRAAIVAMIAAPSDGTEVVPRGWTAGYAVRRIAWHVLDHAWEMQDRAE